MYTLSVYCFTNNQFENWNLEVCCSNWFIITIRAIIHNLLIVKNGFLRKFKHRMLHTHVWHKCAVAYPSVRLLHFFSFKDKIPLHLRLHVVYHFMCQSCGALYVGETIWHLHTCISDHMGISPLTSKKCTNHPLTSILSHHLDTDHPVSFDDFKILFSCPFQFKLLLRESLLICNLKPSLNANIGSAPLFLLQFLFLSSMLLVLLILVTSIFVCPLIG